MATYNGINDWLENLCHNVDCETDQFVVALSITNPATDGVTADGDGVLANVTQISYTNLSTRNITTTGSGQTGGVYTLKLVDLVLTAGGGAVTGFRWVYIYDDTPTLPSNPLVCYYDYGSTVNLASGETFTIDFDATNGLFKVS